MNAGDAAKMVAVPTGNDATTHCNNDTDDDGDGEWTLVEENSKLIRRVDELEHELAELRKKVVDLESATVRTRNQMLRMNVPFRFIPDHTTSSSTAAAATDPTADGGAIQSTASGGGAAGGVRYDVEKTFEQFKSMFMPK